MEQQQKNKYMLQQLKKQNNILQCWGDQIKDKHQDQNAIINYYFDEDGKEDDDNDDDEDNHTYSQHFNIDEDMEMLKFQVSLLENEEDIQNHLDKYLEENQFSNKIDYKKLYNKMKQKAHMLIQIIQEITKQENEQQQKDIKQLQYSIDLENKITQLEHQNQELQEQCERLKINNIKLREQLNTVNLQKIRSQEQEISIKNQDKENVLQKLLNYSIDNIQSQNLDDMTKVESQLFQCLQKLQEFKNQKIKIMRQQIEKQEPVYCIICVTQVADIVIKPCNHICLCQTCSYKVMECPMDRKQIKSTERVYYP